MQPANETPKRPFHHGKAASFLAESIPRAFPGMAHFPHRTARNFPGRDFPSPVSHAKIDV
jgi:hypothetical protein